MLVESERNQEGIGVGDIPSQTASKHRSSHVITTSAETSLTACHFSGAVLTLRFRSSMFKIPLAVYLSRVIEGL